MPDTPRPKTPNERESLHSCSVSMVEQSTALPLVEAGVVISWHGRLGVGSPTLEGPDEQGLVIGRGHLDQVRTQVVTQPENPKPSYCANDHSRPS